jgi:hypothetical protein
MKILRLLLALLFTATAFAQQTVVLNWTVPTIDAGGTVNIYRATSACSGSANFSKFTSGIAIAAGTFTDATVPTGSFTYCYYAIAVVNGVSAPHSNQYQASVLPQAVGLTGTVTGTVSVVKRKK